MELPYCEWTVEHDSGDFLMFCDHQNKTARIHLGELETASVHADDGEAILEKLKTSRQLEIGCDRCDWLNLPVSIQTLKRTA